MDPKRLIKKESTIFLGALAEYRSQQQKKDTEKGKIIEWVYNVSHMWSESKPELSGNHLSPKFVLHNGSFSFQGTNVSALAKVLHALVENYQFCVDEVIHSGSLEDGLVVVKAHHNGIWKVEMPEFPQTKEFVGKEWKHHTCDIFKVKNGVAQEVWMYDGANELPGYDQISAYLASTIMSKEE